MAASFVLMDESFQNIERLISEHLTRSSQRILWASYYVSCQSTVWNTRMLIGTEFELYQKAYYSESSVHIRTKAD